jgi:hypothetical protein
MAFAQIATRIGSAIMIVIATFLTTSFSWWPRGQECVHKE